MNSKSQFHSLEVMSRERAAVARNEMEYWLNEAEEWAQLRKSETQSRCLDKCQDEFEHPSASTHPDVPDCSAAPPAESSCGRLGYCEVLLFVK
jgi:hypothetical protein